MQLFCRLIQDNMKIITTEHENPINTTEPQQVLLNHISPTSKFSGRILQQPLKIIIINYDLD